MVMMTEGSVTRLRTKNAINDSNQWIGFTSPATAVMKYEYDPVFEKPVSVR